MTPQSLCMGCMADKGNVRVCGECGWREGTPAESPLQLAPRTVLNERYLLGRVLGQGGFGITYLAWDLTLNCKLAVKEYYPANFCMRGTDVLTVRPLTERTRELFEYGLKKFVEEGQALARFRDHPGIVSVFDFLRANGTAYIVMAYLDGVSFKQYLQDHGERIPFQR